MANWWDNLGIAGLPQAPVVAAQPAVAPVEAPALDEDTQYQLDNANWEWQNNQYDDWINNLGWSQDKLGRSTDRWNQLEQQRLNNTGYGSNRFYANGEIYNYDPNAQVYRGTLSGSTYQQPATTWDPSMALQPQTPTNTYEAPPEPLPPAEPSPLPPNITIPDPNPAPAPVPAPVPVPTPVPAPVPPPGGGIVDVVPTPPPVPPPAPPPNPGPAPVDPNPPDYGTPPPAPVAPAPVPIDPYFDPNAHREGDVAGSGKVWHWRGDRWMIEMQDKGR